ncbi:Y55_G0043920.mRNA.1.CDS.1 [Saccharomyces cerevisiae]|nr:Y55_G0043920.mRNA.1.CDS.1 [Saccharomyces cerevisiae]
MTFEDCIFLVHHIILGRRTQLYKISSIKYYSCYWYIEKWVNVEIIVGIPLLIKAIILGIQNLLEVLIEDLGILKMESIFLHTNITNIPHSVLYVPLSYYIINSCTSASSNFDDSFS